MTFQTLAEYVAFELRPDGDTAFTLPESTPYFSTPYGIRLDLLLKRFSRDTLLLFTPNVEITVSEGDREFDFSDPANCALALFDVHRIYLANERITRHSSTEKILRNWSPLTPAGRPYAYAPLSDYKILFEVECADDIEDCFAQGFYRHPTITADNSPVSIPDEYLDIFARYAAAFLRSNVASDEIGLARLARVDQAAAQGVRKMKTDALMRMLQAGGSK